jgi:hypothetical protein
MMSVLSSLSVKASNCNAPAGREFDSMLHRTVSVDFAPEIGMADCESGRANRRNYVEGVKYSKHLIASEPLPNIFSTRQGLEGTRCAQSFAIPRGAKNEQDHTPEHLAHLSQAGVRRVRSFPLKSPFPSCAVIL